MFGRKLPEVLVVGAGPVGLMTALSLSRRGISVQIVDKDWRTASHAYALALHPSTLSLFEEVGILDRILEQAHRVRTVGLYDAMVRRGELSISRLATDFSFLAILGQDVLENLLEEALRKYGVKVRWNHHVSHLAPLDDGARVTVDKLQIGSTGYSVAHGEWQVAHSKTFEVPFVVGADGYQSDVRKAMGIDFFSYGPPTHFAIFEFKTEADLRDQMYLVLDDQMENVLWPLPDGGARWSFQLPDFVDASPRSKDRHIIQLAGAHYQLLGKDVLQGLIAERAPWFTAPIDTLDWRLVARFEKRLAQSFGHGRVWLAGDAGHMTGPVGVQSMNVGLREAHDLAEAIAAIQKDGASVGRLHAYNDQRLAEWRSLLGLEGGLRADASTPSWLAGRTERLLSCFPASGDNLLQLTGQLGFEMEMAEAAV